MPVRMRRAPSTPNPGSIFVSSVIGLGVADAEVDVLELLADAVEVGVIVETRVTLKMVV
jgi:hypothetical protein